MTTHSLKCWPEPFTAIVSGEKRHEVRRNDRGYAVGDVLQLREWHDDVYTGREVAVRVTYVTAGGTWGLPDELCVMSVEKECQ